MAYFGVLNPEKFKPKDEAFICSHLTKIDGNVKFTYSELLNRQNIMFGMYNADVVISVDDDGYSTGHDENIVRCVIPSKLCYYNRLTNNTYDFCINFEININVDRGEWEEWYEKE